MSSKRVKKTREAVLSIPPIEPDVVVGIDPGKRGGLAALTYPGKRVYNVYDMPIVDGVVDAMGIVNWLLAIWEKNTVFVGIERQQARPGQAGVVSNISNYGRILAAVEVAFHAAMYQREREYTDFRQSYVEFHPSYWQRALFGGNSYDKAIGIAYCRDAGWPVSTKKGGKPMDGITDALCIADYTANVVRIFSPTKWLDTSCSLV